MRLILWPQTILRVKLKILIHTLPINLIKIMAILITTQTSIEKIGSIIQTHDATIRIKDETKNINLIDRKKFLCSFNINFVIIIVKINQVNLMDLIHIYNNLIILIIWYVILVKLLFIYILLASAIFRY